jgi:TonB family protein
MIMLAVRIAIATLLALLLITETVQAQDGLAGARDLYASAQYDEALEVLDRLSSEAPPTEVRQSIDLYRTLCLLAVGRPEDAERTIEAIIARDPLFRPGDDLPPRTRAAFSEAKNRVLPTLVQQQYGEAKAAFDRKEFETAAALFEYVMAALNDPDLGAAAKQPPLADLRTLAAGFHDLSLKAIPPPAPPPPPPAPEPEPVVPQPPRIYGGDEPGVRLPVTIAQDMPRFPGIVPTSGLRGVVEVVIDEKGAVESARMVSSITSAYDKILLTAASRWRFQPAMANGAPVKFRKRIQIAIAPGTR